MRGSLAFVGLLLIGCGGAAAGQPAPAPAPVVPAPAPAPQEEPTPVVEEEPPSAAPEFTEGMSVDEAINVVPQGSERANLDMAALAHPISDMKLYEPCGAKPNDHVKIRIAVWDGRAVGIDAVATPTNAKLVECVKEQIRTVQWRDREKSLNTVEFAF